MRTLGRAVRRKEVGGEPLPVVFPSLAKLKAHFRRSEFSMVAGQPGARKSTMALWMAKTWVMRDGLRGLYLAADSSELVMASRAAGMIQGVSVSDVEKRLERGDETSLAALDSLEGLDFCFDAELNYQTMDMEFLAFEEKWGQYPAFVIVDNLSDVEDDEGGDEFSSLRKVGREMTKIARNFGTAVIALHHTSEDERYDKSPCPPRKAVMGKVAVKQAIVLTIGEGTAGSMPVAVVKSRFGPSDKSGRSPVYLKLDPETMVFQDLGM